MTSFRFVSLLSMLIAVSVMDVASARNTTSAKAPTVCDKYYSCPESTTCCCASEFGRSCYAWGCCPLEGATCCDDHSCCPHDYPICNVKAGTCLKSKNNPLAVKAAVRTPAKAHWAFSSGDKQQ